MTDTSLNGFSTATEMLAALRTRRISSVELLDQHLRRIERYNPALKAIVTPNYDEAKQVAADADARRARGEEAPLLGLPLVIKDCIYMKGLPTTGGVVERAAAISEEDAPLVARVRAAGGVIMGKTNVPPYAADWQSSNPLFGRTGNPWNLGRTPGGSTGGGAAAVAAGLSPLEFGGDFGGSIRMPAAFCGIYGHKSSETALPRFGHFPGPNTPNGAAAMATQGPLARSADDLELALDVIAGPGGGEEVAWRLELPPSRQERLSDFRVAVMPSLDWLPVDHDILALQETLVAWLQRAGAKVAVAQPEGFDDLKAYYRTYTAIMAAMSSTSRPVEERKAEAEQIRAHGGELAQGWADGLEGSACDYLRWFGQRERYRAAYRALFHEWDILLAPITLVPAFPHTDAPSAERRLNINRQEVDYILQLVYPGLCNLSGQPGTAFPVGLSRDGLPIGLQAIGPYLEDRTPIRFAALVTREFGGYQHPAGYEAD
jgi:amidase